MRYYIKCKLNPKAKDKLADSIKSGSLARGNVFYEGMQTALREGTIEGAVISGLFAIFHDGDNYY
jgi:hypothetical protein